MRVASLVKLSAIAMMAGTLSACAAPGFRTEVSRFQQMPAPQGQSFFIEPADEANRGGLEFAHYASLVADRMTQLGYRPATSADAADFAIHLGYSVDQGRERVVHDPFYADPFYAGGWGRGFYGRPVPVRMAGGYRYVYGLYDPFLFGPSFGDYGVDRYTVYTSGVTMLIAQREGGQHLFEGSAEAASRTNDLTRLVPNLIEAIFTGFPGNSGEKLRITVAPPATNRR